MSVNDPHTDEDAGGTLGFRVLADETGTRDRYQPLIDGPTCPSLRYQQATGVQVSADYAFPCDNSASGFQYILERDAHMYYIFDPHDVTENGAALLLSEMNEIYTALVRLNPQLNGIDVDLNNFQELANVIYGIVSRFNVDDIQFFLDYRIRKDLVPIDSETYRLLDEHIHRARNVGAGWYQSPKTMKRMYDTLPDDQKDEVVWSRFEEEFSEYLAA